MAQLGIRSSYPYVTPRFDALSAAQKGAGLISQAVREALGTLVNPAICDQLLSRSLTDHGLSEIPEQGPAVGAWLERSLSPLVTHAVGPDAAELLLSELSPVAAYAAAIVQAAPSKAPSPPGGFPPDPPLNVLTPLRDTPLEFVSPCALAPEDITRPVHVSPAPSPRASRRGETTERFVLETPIASRKAKAAAEPCPPSTASREPTRPQNMANLRAQQPLPRVLVATRQPACLDSLQRYLGGTVSVLQISDLVTLLEALEGAEASQFVLLIDCQQPSVHASSVAALRADMPIGTTVLIWGADDATWRAIDADKSHQDRWVRCSREATLEDVGSLCSMLLG